ncbi:hypothetical protein B0T22DRAFT_87952 [Podospora appendiculata]|uniref:Uncharacterized protein n=1 Tax=Podospora appendiculata TaxID=314037 RepID=A0AAE0XK77_9PEZI|nr:hypothetical protein B0T22DRAFT_87952 [Podospora appendiculata]
MPIRNPFARRPGVVITQDENVRPGSSAGNADVAHPGFERVDTVGSKASSALSITSRKSQDTGEYKMSVVNDSGVYLPPSPVEREPAWPKRYLSRTSSDTNRSGSGGGEIEHFSISRESFDSYRRSFDICARSPIVASSDPARQSLDSARYSRMPRSSMHERHFEREPPTPEEGFEDVGLNDEGKHQPPKKRSFFSKFGSDAAAAPDSSSAHHGTTTYTTSNSQTMSRFLLPGRKRGISGQGAELGAMPIVDRPSTANSLREQQVEA